MSDPHFYSSGHSPLDDIPIPFPPKFLEVLKPNPIPNRRASDQYQPGTPPMYPPLCPPSPPPAAVPVAKPEPAGIPVTVTPTGLDLRDIGRDATVIPEQWTFKDASVADNFDKHVREQLPWYDLVTNMVRHIGLHYLPQNGRMYDLGASTGNITLALKDAIESRDIDAISVDYSEEMVKIWRGVGHIVEADIRDFDIQPYDFCTCFLVLMFLDPASQVKVFKKLLSNLKQGGALLVFDKVETQNGYLGTVLHRLTIAGKVSTGVPPEEIIKKELSLAGMQRPLSPNFMMACGASAEQVFRFGEFAGWIITR